MSDGEKRHMSERAWRDKGEQIDEKNSRQEIASR